MKATLHTLCGCTKVIAVPPERNGWPPPNVKIAMSRPFRAGVVEDCDPTTPTFRVRQFRLGDVLTPSPDCGTREAHYYEEWD